MTAKATSTGPMSDPTSPPRDGAPGPQPESEPRYLLSEDGFPVFIADPAHWSRPLSLSRGEQEHLQRYREHMGWEFPWYTLRDDFDADHDVAEWHGTNVFLRDGDEVCRTYFIGARGDEALGSTWSFLDITPYGRQEEWEDSPADWPQTPPYIWAGWHDKYDRTL